MKKYLKIVLLVSMAVMFSKGPSTQAMEPSEREPKKIKLETNITTNNSILTNGNIKNKCIFERSNPPVNELSAAGKLKKEQKLHEYRKKLYYELGFFMAPFKTLSAQLSCIRCEVGDKFSFDTPFGRVNCEKRGKDNYYINPDEEGTKYRDIVRVVNKMIKKNSRGDTSCAKKIKDKIASTILNYISMPADERIRTLQDFGEIRFNEVIDITDWSPTERKDLGATGDALIFSRKECDALAVLSALMMLSEPARNQMGGKYERAAIREWRDDPDPMSMEKIFDNDTFKGGDKLKVPYLMSLEYGKDSLNNLVDGRCHNEDRKEALESLNKSISFKVDGDENVVYQSK
ncbi:MAG: hypothetical protein Q4B93_00605 [Clostridia bacterium]|nr:hypothetical protein [Clostridia bacterium]